MQKIKQHLSLLHQLPLSSDISAAFLNLMESYSLSHKLSVPDALIAATALEHELPLFTLNLKDFRFIATLQLYTLAK